MDGRVEHCVELYTIENTVSEEAINSIQQLPVLQALDNVLTTAALRKAN